MNYFGRTNSEAPPAVAWKKKYVTSGDYRYEGWAVPGTATSAAAWAVKRLTFSSDDLIAEEWAGVSAEQEPQFNQIWDNYASLTYA
jgi:hypothetical protein